MDKTLQYLYGLERFGIKLGLQAITELLDRLDNPQHKFKSIHVTGTNGKGSTCAFLDSIFQQAGFKVGLYTSPHLVRFTERIKVNGKEIKNKELVELTKFIKQKAEENHLHPTFFEFTTALAFLYFVQNKIDWAVIEVGMGGRLDATNVIIPEVSVITNIDYDHMSYLGDTKKKIAGEKAGIIKENIPLITAEKENFIINVFKEKCLEKKAELIVLNESYQIKKSDLKGQVFVAKKERWMIPLLGEYQIQNTLLALLVIEVLHKKGLNISGEVLKKGLKKTKWPGRLQILKKKPLVIVDGSHNLEGFTYLSSYLKQFPQRKIMLIGIKEDKQVSEMVALLSPLMDEIIISQSNYKPANPYLLEKEVKKYKDKVKVVPDFKEAIKEAIKLTNPEDLLLIAGSLYLVGDFLAQRMLFNKLFKEKFAGMNK